ncbi:RNA-directed DNA polymerase, eukaryota [Tanacetum coccineum]|uniref:RNA-directed DNA polymerase, eukaryota n=1 Tax=Tanacetum coccineum TaxID=301880 RepID=A0ABQ5HZT6_9ASTR
MTNSLPTRFNISRRGIDIESISCVNCDVGIETNDHLFFACNTAKKISKLINRWWDVPFMDINSYGEWRSWIDNVKLPKKNKSMFQAIEKSLATQVNVADAEIDKRFLNIGEQIASGSCGDLFRGEYLGHDVTVKILRSEYLNETLEDEFVHEVAMLR